MGGVNHRPISNLINNNMGLIGNMSAQNSAAIGNAISPGMGDMANKLQSALDAFEQKLPAQARGRLFLQGFKSGGPIGGLIKLLKGTTFSEGEMVLGEKFMLYVAGIDIHNRRDVPDDAIRIAKSFFTELFGVTIDNIRDIDELNKSAAAYKNYHSDRHDLWGNDDARVDKAFALRKTLPNNDMPGAWQQPIVNWLSNTSDSVNQISEAVDNGVNSLFTRLGISKKAVVDSKGNLVNASGEVLLQDKTKNTIMVVGVILIAFIAIRRIFS